MLGSFIHREQYSLDLIPFDGDLLSMESESAFKVSPRLVSEEQRRAVLRWLLVFGAGRSEGITQPAGKGAEQSRGAELLCALGEGTSTPAPPAVAAGAASANGVFLSLRVQERAPFVSAHSWGPRAEVHAEPRQLPPTSCVSHSPSAASGDRKVREFPWPSALLSAAQGTRQGLQPLVGSCDEVVCAQIGLISGRGSLQPLRGSLAPLQQPGSSTRGSQMSQCLV